MRRTGKIRTALTAFRRSEDGTILVLFAIFFAVMLGMVALAFDMGKVAATQTELQSYADTVALAAAGELDGRTGAIARAEAAAAELIQDTQSFGGARDLDFAELDLVFLSDIPAKDYNAPADFLAFATTDDAEARYAWVRFATPRTVATVFREAFAATAGFDQATAASSQVGAEAMAKMTGYACDAAVMMFCIPPAGYTPVIGQSILLRTGGNGAAWAPGDFGFVDPTDLAPAVGGPCDKENGIKLIACIIASSGGGLQRCISTDGIDLKPGQRNGAEAAVFNTRFDIFESTMNSKKGDARFGPAPHVISGLEIEKNGCVKNSTAAGDTSPFPPDTCQISPATCGRFGDGNWDRGKYFDKNYGNGDGTFDAVTEAAPLATKFSTTAIASATGKTGAELLSSGTRWQIYQAEHLAAIGAGGQLNDILTGRLETGRPQCSKNVNPNPERRTIVAAGINCDTNGDGSIDVSGAAQDLKPDVFLRLLLLAPVGKGTAVTDDEGKAAEKFEYYVEVVEILDAPGGGSFVEAGVFREVVELVK